MNLTNFAPWQRNIGVAALSLSSIGVSVEGGTGVAAPYAAPVSPAATLEPRSESEPGQERISALELRVCWSLLLNRCEFTKPIAEDIRTGELKIIPLALNQARSGGERVLGTIFNANTIAVDESYLGSLYRDLRAANFDRLKATLIVAIVSSPTIVHEAFHCSSHRRLQELLGAEVYLPCLEEELQAYSAQVRFTAESADFKTLIRQLEFFSGVESVRLKISGEIALQAVHAQGQDKFADEVARISGAAPLLAYLNDNAVAAARNADKFTLLEGDGDQSLEALRLAAVRLLSDADLCQVAVDYYEQIGSKRICEN